MAKAKHIIHKLVLQVEVQQRSSAQKVQDDVVRHFEQVIYKQLEKLLDELDVPGHVLIDKIDLDLGSGKLEDVLGQLTASLTKVLDPVINPSGLPNTEEEEAEIRHSSLNEEQKAFEVFVHFIATGKLPWYVTADTDWLRQEDVWLDKMLPALVKDGSFRSKLIAVFRNSTAAVNRLFKQFSIASVKKLIVVLLAMDEQQVQKDIDAIVNQLKEQFVGKASEEETMSDQPKRADSVGFDNATLASIVEKILISLYVRLGYSPVLSEEIKREIIALLIESLSDSAQPSTSKLIEIAGVIFKQLESPSIIPNNKPTATPDNTPEPNLIQKEDEGGVYVSQAGLVILHPFLEYFFKDFGLLQDNDFVDLPARQLAVHLLHYLGTGNTNAFEYDLYFEKFLCRWPLDELLERDVEIPQRMLDEGDNMLRTVIKYWKALKNTSPDGLREGFICRNGKLIEAEQPARLIVERMDLDILLSTLPWGLGVIKLSWMVEPFYVEWQ